MRIQQLGNFGFVFAVVNECLVNPPDDFDLLVRPAHQHHAVGLDAFLLAHFQLAFSLAALVNQHPAQTEPSRAALLEIQVASAGTRLEKPSSKVPGCIHPPSSA